MRKNEMHARRFGILFATLLVTSCRFATPSMDPGLPGGSGPSADGMKLQFVGMMMGVVRGELEAWGASVREQGNSPLADHYSLDASVVQPGAAFLKGSSALQSFADRVTSDANDANASMLDMEVSDGIAWVYGAFRFQPREAGIAASAGRHVTVLRRVGADWRIRTQFFHAGADKLSFPDVEASGEPSMLDLGTTDSGQIPRDAFVAAVTSIAGLRRAWEENDVPAARRFFARNAMVLMPNDEAPARGDAVADVIRGAVASFASFETTELDFTSSGRLAVLVGEYSLPGRSDEAAHDGHYTALLAKDGRDWKIRSLILD
jgi:ketosteroid isomerase-like protein